MIGKKLDAAKSDLKIKVTVGQHYRGLTILIEAEPDSMAGIEGIAELK